MGSRSSVRIFNLRATGRDESLVYLFSKAQNENYVCGIRKHCNILAGRVAPVLCCKAVQDSCSESMETHRYVRKSLVDSPRDRYDLNLRQSAHASATSSDRFGTEYWTNGTTSLLSVPSTKPLENTSPARQQPPMGTGNVLGMTENQGERTAFAGRSRPALALSSSNPPNNLVRNSLLAGSASGMASIIACHPFDVLRVKMQSSALASTQRGLSGTVRHTLQLGGIRALYTGLALPLGAQAVYKATIFTANNVTEQAIKEWRTQENYKLGNFSEYKLSYFDRFVSGFIGGALNAALFVTPVEFVRNQQIALASGKMETPHMPKSPTLQSQRLPGPMAIVRSTLQAEGLSGLWRGMLSTVLRDSLGCGCFFTAMAYSQDLLRGHHDPASGPPSKAVLIASGAIAGVGFWFIGLPLDTMKTWIQNGSARNLQHAWELSQRDGFVNSMVSLTRGWQVAYGRGAPSAAITVTTYSLVYSLLSP